MKKCFGVALLAVPLLALPARAGDPFAPQLPYKIETGANIYFRVLSRENGWGCQLGPWYNYWPLEAHFQTPAVPCFPYWPAPQTLPSGASTVTPPGPPAVLPTLPAHPPAGADGKPVIFRPVAYRPYGTYGYGPPPAFWTPR